MSTAPRPRRLHHLVIGTVLLALHAGWTAPVANGAEEAARFRVGTAQLNITPEQPMWMSGYAARNRPADGTLHPLFARAIVIEDSAGNRVAGVALDVVGVSRDVTEQIRQLVSEQSGIETAELALWTSHTHSGPVIGTNLKPMYFLPTDQWQLISGYTEQLIKRVAGLVDKAADNLAPAELSWGIGEADFAVNRRNNREADVPDLRAAGSLRGPVDHDVPVLAVRREGELVAVVFGYACHATVLNGYDWSGDYPGVAAKTLQERHPGATAVFFAGCGGDQNPIPRRKVEHAEEYGRRLADAVDEVLGGEMQPLAGSIVAAYEEIDLPFAELPSREELETRLTSDNKYEVGRAKHLLADYDRDGELSPTYPYPIQLWRFGDELAWIHLGGEVTVEYSLRIKEQLDAEAVFVAGYANDVMAYIPSERVLEEGGYEGARSMVYYGRPSVWAAGIEQTILEAVNNLVGEPVAQ